MSLKNAIDAIAGTMHRDAVAQPAAASLVNASNRANRLFPYILPKSGLSFVGLFGITVPPFGTIAHSHPVHKTVEVNLLHNVLPSTINGPTACYFMKPRKFTQLRQLYPGIYSELRNYHYSARDESRYPTIDTSVTELENAFFHDSIHFWKPSQIMHFFENNPSVQRIYASIVVPPELFISSSPRGSFFPEVYQYDVEGETLTYRLEASKDSYTQPASSIDWLTTSKVVGKIPFSIEKLSSWGPVHLLLISRKLHMVSAPHQDFCCPDAIIIKNPDNLNSPVRDRLVPAKVYSSLFHYVRAVRTLRVTDPNGFIRNQQNKEEYSWVTDAAWEALVKFTQNTHSYSVNARHSLFIYPHHIFIHWFRANARSFHYAASALITPVAGILQILYNFIRNHAVRSLRIASFNKEFSLPFWLRPRPITSLSLSADNWVSISKPTSPLLIRVRDMIPSVPSWPKPAWWPTKLAWPFVRSSPFINLQLVDNSPPFSTPTYSRKILWCGFALTAAYFSWITFCSKLSAQAIHDQHNEYFHDNCYTLRLPQKSASAEPEWQPFGTSGHVGHPAPPCGSPPPPPAQGGPPSGGPPSGGDDDDDDLPPSSIVPPPERPATMPIILEEEEDAESEVSTSADVSSEELRNLASPVDLPPPLGPLYENTSSPTLEEISEKLPSHATPDPEPQLSALASDTSAEGSVLPWCTIMALVADNYNVFPSRRRIPGAVLPPFPQRNTCLFDAVSEATGYSASQLWGILGNQLPNSQLVNASTIAHGYSTEHLVVLAYLTDNTVTIISQWPTQTVGPPSARGRFTIYHSPGHWSSSPIARPSNRLIGASLSYPTFEDDLLKFRTSDGYYLPFNRFHTAQINLKRAKTLSSNLKNGLDGIFRGVLESTNRSEVLASLDSISDLAPSHSVRVAHLSGFAGCGKSKPICDFFRGSTYRDEMRVVVPNVDLRDDWKKKLRLPATQNWRINTWESGMFKNSRILVIDEVYKMPPGYFDLITLFDRSITHVIILGCPIQGTYHSMNPESSLKTLAPETSRLRPFIDYYCAWSYRCPKDICDLFDVTCMNNRPGASLHTRKIHSGVRTLTASANASKELNNCGHNAQTVASSQGLTLAAAQIFIDRSWFLLSDRMTLVALTRHKERVYIAGELTTLSRQLGIKTVFTAFLRPGSKVPMQHWPELAGVEILRQPLKERVTILRGAASGPSVDRPVQPFLSRSEKVPIDFTLDIVRSSRPLRSTGVSPEIPQPDTTILPTSRRPLHVDLPSSLPSDVKPSPDLFTSAFCEPVYPGVDSHQLMSTFIENTEDRFDKEIRFKDEWSGQFPEMNEEYTEGSCPPNLLAPWHRPSADPTLLEASIPKRLRFRNSSLQYEFTDKDVLLASHLYSAWCDVFGYDENASQPFDPVLFAECIADNEYHQLTSKSKATIVANAYRSDPDWRYSVVRIFAKAQHKVNDSSILTGWKACQTLALGHDAVVLILGPVKKYQRIMRDRVAHPLIFIHAGHTPTQLSDWCKEHFNRDQLCVENDYTAFDQSQGGEAVLFEVMKMERLNIPQVLIDLHMHLKTNVSCQFGDLTSMRLTGEPGTYDDNTDYNIAVLASRYNLTGVPFCVSGDDSVIARTPPPGPNWLAVSRLLSLTFKIHLVERPLFCGYFVGHHGAIRSPYALFAKLYEAYNDGSLPDKMASYVAEFAVGHSLGQDLWDLLPDSHFQWQSACFDFFCRHACKSLKDALKLGEPPENILALMGPSVSSLSRPLWYLLSNAVRRAIRASKPLLLPFDSDNPKLASFYSNEN